MLDDTTQKKNADFHFLIGDVKTHSAQIKHYNVQLAVQILNG